MGTSPMMQASVFANAQFVNGLRLLRLVRLRRELRMLWRLALLALPVWFGLIVWIQASTPDDSDAWNWVNDAAGPGFLIIGCVVVLGLVGMVVTGVAAGVTGRVAAAFAPVVGKGREATVEGDADALSGLLPRLRKQPFLSVGLVLLFVLFTAVGVLAVTNVTSAYAANHGRGGPVVTVGRDADVDGYTDSGGSGRYSSRHRDYFLMTPEGKAIAETGEPTDGQQWVVVPNTTGGDSNDEAYLVGGHDYLLVGGLALFAAVVDVFVLLGIVAGFRREFVLRRRGGHVPLAYSVRRLAAGARPVVRFDQVRSMAIGLPPLPTDSDDAARRLLRKRRLFVVLVVVVVLALVAAGVFLRPKPTPPLPQTNSDVTLPYLTGTSWSPDTDVFYGASDVDAARATIVDALRDGGVTGNPIVVPVWSVVITSSNADDPTDANVDVAGIGAVAASKATSGGVVLAKEVAEAGSPAPAAVTGLPEGWTGVLTDGKDKDSSPRSVDVFGSAGGSLVWINIDGGGGTTGDAALSHRAAELASAIAQRSIPRFVTDTAH
jgi:hypothetical protein